MTRNSTKPVEQSTRGQIHTHSRTTNQHSQHGSSSLAPNVHARPYDDVNIIERWRRDTERTERGDRDEGHIELRWERARRERGSIAPSTGMDARRHDDVNIIERSPRGVERMERGDRERGSIAHPTAMEARRQAHRQARRAGLEMAIGTAEQDFAESRHGDRNERDRHGDRHESHRHCDRHESRRDTQRDNLRREMRSIKKSNPPDMRLFHQRMIDVNRRDLAEMDREDEDRLRDGGREARRETEFAEFYVSALPDVEAGVRDPKAFLASLAEGEPNFCWDRGCSCGPRLFFDLVKFLKAHPTFPKPNQGRGA